MRKQVVIGVLIAVFGTTVARAEEPEAVAPASGGDVSLDALLATRAAVGSSRARPLYATPSSVSIIDRATIERFGFRTLGEALDTVAGMADIRTTSRTDVVTSRGVLQDHYVNKVLLMLDGVAIWNPVVGEAKVSRIPLADVERIEVLRGPASVLYGTNAYAGAINVVRRKQAEAGTRVTAEAGVGDQHEVHGSVNAVGRDGAWSTALTAAYQNEEGPRETITDAKGLTGTFNEFRNAASFTGSATYREEHTLSLQVFRTEETKWGNDAEYINGGMGDPMSYQGYLGVYEYRHEFRPGLSGFGRVSYDWTDYLFSRAYGFNPRTNVTGWRLAATMGANVELTDWVTLELSGDGEQRTSVRYHSYSEVGGAAYERDGNLEGKQVNEGSLAAQFDFDLFPFAVLAGARVTFNENAGTNVSPRATALWSFLPGQSVKLIAGQSYRAPSLFEQFFLNNAPGAPGRTLSGNPDLKPETATSVEAAYVGQVGSVGWQALGYWAKYDDKIARVVVPVGTILVDGQPAGPDPAPPANPRTYRMYTNLPGYEAYGAELEFKYTGPSFNGFVAYTYLDSKASGPTYTPTHKVSAGPSYTIGGLTMSAVGNYWSKMDGGLDPTKSVDAQFQLDLAVTYAHRFGAYQVRHMVSAKNVLNEQIVYPDYVDRTLQTVTMTPGQRFFYTLSFTL